MARILFITRSMGFGGAAKMLCFVAESLQSRSHDVCIVNMKSTGNISEYERKVSSDVTVYTIKSRRRLQQIFEIKRVAKQFSADVIIGFTEIPNVIARVVGGMLGKPTIISERGDPSRTGVGKGIKNKLVLKLINTSRGGVFQTEGARNFYGRGLQKRGIVIPNPIFITGEIPQVNNMEREKTVVSVGRLSNEQKRYDVMLDAFKLFLEKHPDYILKLYGKGEDEELIRSFVEDRGLSDKVRFMGLTTNPMQDICRDGMFFITSDYEGISNSLLEAMAVGLPCVSTDHTPGGARLLIQDGENGLLAPIGDAAGLAKAMCRFATDKELAMKCGERAKEVTTLYSPERIINMWESYIKDII